MLRSEKEAVVKELNDMFSRAKSAVLAEFTKLNVETVTKLRKKLRDGGVEYRVLKNTLAKRASKGTSMEPLADKFVGPVAMAISYSDPLSPAKILSEFLKGTESIKVKGGMVEGKALDAKGVETLSKLPGLQELRGQIVGLLNQPATQLVRLLSEPGTQIARVIQAQSEKK